MYTKISLFEVNQPNNFNFDRNLLVIQYESPGLILILEIWIWQPCHRLVSVDYCAYKTLAMTTSIHILRLEYDKNLG